MKRASLPTVASRRLGARLRGYREQAGWDQTTLGEQLGIKQAHMSALERGQRPLSAERLATLLELLAVPAAERPGLRELHARSATPGWWQEFGDLLSDPVQALLELEENASWIRTYDTSVLPGLLQTEAYAREIINASVVHMRVGDLDRYLQLRMRRQKRLHEGDIALTAVVSEAALRQRIGGPEVLGDQLRHVLHLVRTADVTVQVVPFSAGAHAALGETFVIIQWPQADEPAAVYVDGQTSWSLHERQPQLAQYAHAWSSVQARALSADDSLDLCHDLITELQT